MKTSGNFAFINQLLVYVVAMVAVSGSVGLGTVWLRHQISVAAHAVKAHEQEITRLERRIAETHALIAVEQSPEMLERKNLAMALQLIAPREAQLVRVTESPEQRLLARRNLEIFTAEQARAAATVSFRIAEAR